MAPGVSVDNVSANAYCLKTTSATGTVFYFAGPGGTVTSTKPVAGAGGNGATITCA
jgi:hypothetical protein